MKGDKLLYFDVDVFEDAIEGAVDDAEKAVKAAIKSTMGKTRRHAVTLLSKLIREKWNIKKKDLDKKIRVRIGSRGLGGYYESFEMTIKGTSISLAYFTGTKQFAGRRVQTRTVGRVRKNRSRFQGVQVEVLKGRKTKLDGAFIQAADSGHLMVMKRKGKGRYPVAIKASISPASMFSDWEVADRFEDGLMDYLERTFEHELFFRLRQYGLA